jgi:hypothetical protein
MPNHAQPSTQTPQPDRIRPDSASELAWGIGELAVALPPEVTSDLKRLLARSITDPRPGERRDARLGLLVELVAGAEGEIPTIDDYEATRAQRRRERGEDWPAHTTISRAWGHWLKAVAGAMRLAFRPSGGRVPETTHHVPAGGEYTREEVLAAISECRFALGFYRVPADNAEGGAASLIKAEYEEWAKLRRRAARLAGQPGPRLPTREPIVRFFGSFERAEVASRKWAETK